MNDKINTVCIVDDDVIYQFTTVKEIELTKLVDKIIVFSNGEKAIDFFKGALENLTSLPDLIFLDVNMPVMDGWQFLEEYLAIKSEINKKIIIYLVSSSVDNRDIDRARKINEVKDYIIKPISRTKLVDIFRNSLQSV